MRCPGSESLFESRLKKRYEPSKQGYLWSQLIFWMLPDPTLLEPHRGAPTQLECRLIRTPLNDRGQWWKWNYGELKKVDAIGNIPNICWLSGNADLRKLNVYEVDHKLEGHWFAVSSVNRSVEKSTSRKILVGIRQQQMFYLCLKVKEFQRIIIFRK